MKITDSYSFRGELSVPGDKSISHRGIMFGAISNGLTEILTGCRLPFDHLLFSKTWDSH